MTDECTHNVDEKGYIVIEMYEMWKYKRASIEHGNSLVTDFINKFLKVKKEASRVTQDDLRLTKTD